MSCTGDVSEIINSSAVLTPAAKGFQLLGIAPGLATSDVRIVPGIDRSTIWLSFSSRSSKSPATRKSPNALITPQRTVTELRERMLTCTISVPTDDILLGKFSTVVPDTESLKIWYTSLVVQGDVVIVENDGGVYPARFAPVP